VFSVSDIRLQPESLRRWSVPGLLIALLAAILILAPRAEAADPPVYVSSFGDAALFDSVGDIAADANGHLYVLDVAKSRVQKFTLDGQLLDEWGGVGMGNGQFKNPRGIGVTASGEVWVADTDNNRVQRFSADGVYLDRWGTAGNGDTQFSKPADIAPGLDGRVLVADTGNNRVSVFESNGVFVTKWGMFGMGDGFFNEPRGIATDPSGRIYVGDTGNSRVQKFNGFASFGGKWGSKGSAPGQFMDSPRGIGIAENGNIFTTDRDNHRVQMFSSVGEPLAEWGTVGTDPGEFISPQSLTIGSDGAVYVLDSGNKRVQKFAFPPAPPTALTSDPASPGKVSSIRIKGDAGTSESVRIYKTADCSGSPVVQGPAAKFKDPGLTVKVAAGSTTVFKATAVGADGLASACSEESVKFVNRGTGKGQLLPGIKGPNGSKAMWDGKNLHVRLKCPARFRPGCASKAQPVTLRSWKGRAMAKKVKVSVQSGGWVRVRFAIKPKYRAKVAAMTYRDEKLLTVKQVIRSKRVGYRKAKRPSVVFHTYKVRVKD